jgi:hypothetical protein
MDVLGANQMSSKKQPKRITKKPIKVVYISTPMKVKTSASKFRDLVQELTGQNSDTTQYVEVNGAADDEGDANCRHDFPKMITYSESSFNPSQNMLRSFDLM